MLTNGVGVFQDHVGASYPHTCWRLCTQLQSAHTIHINVYYVGAVKCYLMYISVSSTCAILSMSWSMFMVTSVCNSPWLSSFCGPLGAGMNAWPQGLKGKVAPCNDGDWGRGVTRRDEGAFCPLKNRCTLPEVGWEPLHSGALQLSPPSLIY